MKSNKRMAEDWPTLTTKRPATSGKVDSSIPAKAPKNFMLNCLSESKIEVMEYVTKEAEKINEFNALDMNQKDDVLSSISEVIHRRCHHIMSNKDFSSREDIISFYYQTYPKEKGLDVEIFGMLLDIPSTIYNKRIDESIEKCFKKIIANLKSSEDENILQCIEKKPSVEAMECKTNRLDGNVDVERKESENRRDNKEENYKVLDVNEEGRKKLDEYYEIIDQLIAPKVFDLLIRHRSEFQEILKNSKEYVLEEAKIKLQLREEIEKTLKTENEQKIENYQTNENNNCEERDPETYIMNHKFENHYINEKVYSETDSTDREMSLDNDEVDTELTSENVGMNDKYLENGNIIEENTESVKINEDNSENDNMNEVNPENENISEVNSENYNSQVERKQDKLAQGNENVFRPAPEYRVKLVCMPDLPSRELMLEFLNPFNTKTIKKHKTVKNLLIITLSRKEDYNRILKANGTTIGSKQLLISSETNSIEVKKHKLNVTEPIDNKSDDRPEFEIVKQPNDKINAEKDINNDIRKEVEDPMNEREGNSGVIVPKVTVKQEPVEPTDDRFVKVKKEIDIDKEIVESNINVSTRQTNVSEFVAWLTASPILPKEIDRFVLKHSPTSIEKHKKIPNVLLVTFKNKTVYENFLTMDGHQINSGAMSINIKIMKDPQIGENLSDVAKEQSNIKESNKAIIDLSNAEGNKTSIKVLDKHNIASNFSIKQEDKILKEITKSNTEHDIKQSAKKSYMNDKEDVGHEIIKENILDSQTTNTNNNIDNDKISPKVSTNRKLLIVKTVTAINKEHEIDKVSKVNIQVLNKRNEIVTRPENNGNKKINTHTRKTDRNTPKTDCVRVKVESENVIKVEDDVKINQKAENREKTKENNTQVNLNNKIIKVEDDTIIVKDNSSAGSGDDIIILDSDETFDESNKDGDVEICDNDVENYGILKNIIDDKIAETFSKIRQRNKETNFELLNCKKPEESKQQNKESVENTRNVEDIKLIEKMFHKELNVLAESILTTLNEDEEYVTIKSIVTDNTKRLNETFLN